LIGSGLWESNASASAVFTSFDIGLLWTPLMMPAADEPGCVRCIDHENFTDISTSAEQVKEEEEQEQVINQREKIMLDHNGNKLQMLISKG
jgi:hypothetical protein